MNYVKSKVRGLIYPPGTTPLKWKLFLNLIFSLFCCAMSITILFPFLPAMIKSFGISDEETGYYAGLVASAMFIGRTVACYFWGWLADKVGRRPVMLISLSLLVAGMLGFGFSFTLYMAILTRFFCGLSNGLVGTCKAVASEACDNTNQSLGMSVVLTAWNLGLIVGPAIGGYLAQPAEKYPNVFPKGSFFDQFAYLLPCLINCVALLIATVLDYFYLEETLAAKCERESIASEPGELLPMQSTDLSDNQDDSNKEQLLVESERTENMSSPNTEELAIFIRSGAENKETAHCQSGYCCKNHCKVFGNTKLAVLLRNRNIVLAIGTYCTHSLVIIGFDELFSLWAATQPNHGGLGFSTDQIGTALLCVAAPLLFLQIWLYPKFERRLGAIRVFQISDAVIVIALLSLPFINSYFNRSTVLWPLLIIILLPNKLCTGMAFASTAIFVNNTVPNNLLGSVNGLAMTATSISRAVAPVIAGSAFAWSISHGFKFGFPLDEHFAFVILAFVCVLGIVVSCTLPEGLNRRFTEPAKV